MWYQSFTIHYATHGTYVHTYYCFRPEASVSKVLSARNDTNSTKHELPAKYSTILSGWGNKIYATLSNGKISPKDYDTQKFIIQNHYPSRHEYIYSLISVNHPNNLTHPIDLIAAPQKNLR